MSKKVSSSKTETLSKKEEHPVFDDIFTQFLEKRKRYYTGKMDEIAQLEKLSDLKPDQKEKINKKSNTLEKIKYFDDIKSLYFEAHSKKGKTEATTTQNCTQTQSVCQVTEFVNLLAVGQILKSSSSTHQNSTLDANVLQGVQEVCSILTASNLAQQTSLAKNKLKELVQNPLLKDNLESVLNHQNANTKQSGKEQKKNLFHHSSDDESEVKNTKEVKKTNQNGSTHTTKQVGVFEFVPLPESDAPIVEEFVTFDKVGKPYQGKNKSSRRGDGWKKQEGGQELTGEKDTTRGGYKGKKFDSNFKNENFKKNKDGQTFQEDLKTKDLAIVENEIEKKE